MENVYAIVHVGMQSSSLKLFANLDQKPMLLKRQAFAMFSGELDQYHLYLPLIQGMVLAIYVFFVFLQFCSRHWFKQTLKLTLFLIIKNFSLPPFQSVLLKLCV